MSNPYTGDVTVGACWEAVSGNGDAFLIDVRTAAEWTYVGFPRLPSSERQLFQEWQVYPSMAVDPQFAEKVAARIAELGGSTSSELYFLCRSGVRSMGSAAALSAAGFQHCYNVLDGFEGPPDAEGHRGRIAGWKAAELPWAQR
jgi:rhodanese-related sulfurtransferase